MLPIDNIFHFDTGEKYLINKECPVKAQYRGISGRNHCESELQGFKFFDFNKRILNVICPKNIKINFIFPSLVSRVSYRKNDALLITLNSIDEKGALCVNVKLKKYNKDLKKFAFDLIIDCWNQEGKNLGCLNAKLFPVSHKFPTDKAKMNKKMDRCKGIEGDLVNSYYKLKEKNVSQELYLTLNSEGKAISFPSSVAVQFPAEGQYADIKHGMQCTEPSSWGSHSYTFNRFETIDSYGEPNRNCSLQIGFYTHGIGSITEDEKVQGFTLYDISTKRSNVISSNPVFLKIIHSEDVDRLEFKHNGLLNVSYLKVDRGINITICKNIDSEYKVSLLGISFFKANSELIGHVTYCLAADDLVRRSSGVVADRLLPIVAKGPDGIERTTQIVNSYYPSDSNIQLVHPVQIVKRKKEALERSSSAEIMPGLDEEQSSHVFSHREVDSSSELSEEVAVMEQGSASCLTLTHAVALEARAKSETEEDKVLIA